MSIDAVAKNLLDDKLCSNCSHGENFQGCALEFFMMKPFPKEKTCSEWEEDLRKSNWEEVSIKTVTKEEIVIKDHRGFLRLVKTVYRRVE